MARAAVARKVAVAGERGEREWQAVLARDARADGRFFYAVTSTGIYCRPSCPSRRPHRDRVAFYTTADEAERSGYRACLRCRPRDASSRRRLVEKVAVYVRRRLAEAPDGRITLVELGEAVDLSPSHLQRSFTRATGVSPAEYVSARRMESFKRSLGGGNSVANATYDAGFGSPSRVYERSNAALGMTPGVYRRGGARVTIRYATTASQLGRLLVAATERGLCAVSVGAADAALLAALKREYPAATLEADVGLLGGLVKRVLRVLDGREPGADLPTDLRATAFQRRVWRELQKIPFGETRSYGEIAKKIGRKSAARAVAQACASNRLALVVPCHRVVRDDGDVGGYRWGAARKKKLLSHEAETVSVARERALPKARKRSR